MHDHFFIVSIKGVYFGWKASALSVMSECERCSLSAWSMPLPQSRISSYATVKRELVYVGGGEGWKELCFLVTETPPFTTLRERNGCRPLLSPQTRVKL